MYINLIRSDIQLFLFFGSENCERNGGQVKKIELTLDDGTVLAQSDFYDDMFLLTWTDEMQKGKRNPHVRQVKSIKGYDSEGLVVYEDQ